MVPYTGLIILGAQMQATNVLGIDGFAGLFELIDLCSALGAPQNASLPH